MKRKLNNKCGKDPYGKSLRARVSQEHLDMLHTLKEKFYVNISQFMRNAIEKEYEKRMKNEN